VRICKSHSHVHALGAASVGICKAVTYGITGYVLRYLHSFIWVVSGSIAAQLGNTLGARPHKDHLWGALRWG
jgi:hypothetical protein